LEVFLVDGDPDPEFLDIWFIPRARPLFLRVHHRDDETWFVVFLRIEKTNVIESSSSSAY
jgi:hypothetical protein